jgi:branched-chain amino acid transport system ATP-binding protein
MLELSDVHAFYGESHVLQGVGLTVGEGRVVALLGRNGAGKTTTLRAIMGMTPARYGRIIWRGRDITRLPTHQVARAGVGFVPSGRRVFADLTVRQNLLLGVRPSGGRSDAWNLDRVHILFPKLADLASRQARVLSGGEQQMLKLARCLLGQPRLLLLDEPTEGLAPTVVRDLIGAVRALRDAGLSMLICEQNARVALGIADDAYLLEKGLIRCAGPAAEMAERPEFRAHLGV